MTPGPDPSDPTAGVGGPRPGFFWPGLVVGWAVIAGGVWGLLGHIDHFGGTVDVARLVRWSVGLALVHDLVVGPIVCLVGVAVARWMPPVARIPVQVGLLVSGAVVVFSIPFVRGWGRLGNTPSILPNDYAAGLAWALLAVWVAAAGWLVVRLRR